MSFVATIIITMFWVSTSVEIVSKRVQLAVSCDAMPSNSNMTVVTIDKGICEISDEIIISKRDDTTRIYLCKSHYETLNIPNDHFVSAAKWLLKKMMTFGTLIIVWPSIFCSA